MPLVLTRLGKWLNVSEFIHHKILKGIIWPEFWVNSDDDYDLASRNQVALEKDPTIVLNSKSILCFDVLNNLMIMLSFGLCSPILAVAVTCTVVSRMNVLMLLIGRFTEALRSDVDDDKESVHYGLVALCKIPFPLTEVLKQSFWMIVWTSALFFSLVCWDIAGDEVGWRESVWIPMVTISYPLMLWLIAMCVKNRGTLLGCDDCGGEDENMMGNNTRNTDLELSPLPLPSPSLDAAATSVPKNININSKSNDASSTSNSNSDDVHLNPIHSDLQL